MNQAEFLNGAQSPLAAGTPLEEMKEDMTTRGKKMRGALLMDLSVLVQRAVEGGKEKALLDAAELHGVTRSMEFGGDDGPTHDDVRVGNDEAWEWRDKMRRMIRKSVERVSEGWLEDETEFLDVLPDILAAVADLSLGKSYLSMRTQFEQLLEWADAGVHAAVEEAATEYELMLLLGMMGHPIHVVRCAATQTDPYAIRVARVLASQVASPSLACAMQCETEVVSPEGGAPVEDALLLIDSTWRFATELVYRSKLAAAQAAATLCRNLDVTQAPAQRVALHAHTLYSALRESTGSALRIALRIVYSIRRDWGDAIFFGSSSSAVGDQIKQMLAQMRRGGALTEKDGVEHIVQLLLGMCALDMTKEGPFAPEKLMILCNEALARSARQELHALTKSSDSRTSMEAAISMMCTMLGISAESAPYPTAVHLPEPSWEEVRDTASCQYDLGLENLGLAQGVIRPCEFVQNTLGPVARVVHFANSLQEYAKEVGGWGRLMAELEGDDERVVARLSLCMKDVPTVAAMLRYEEHRVPVTMTLQELQHHTERRVAATMTAQAFLHNTSARRGADIVAKNVLKVQTLDNLVLDVRMAFYEARLGVKVEQWALDPEQLD